MLSPRWRRMPVDQDWPSVWPTAHSYKHSVVPLPIRMGYQKYPERHLPPSAYGNMELVKIPNFLHLTPPAIKRHCDAIKRKMLCFFLKFTSGQKTKCFSSFCIIFVFN